ncbi:MAG: hypothetical protein QCI82_01825 [Candidatus Thermoplasmatota archaeon]|nr:hypothetical protein [Candidatus Thermoplasmatota archaeon]
MSDRVTLEDGTQERFRRKKIVESLKTVGLDSDSSNMIADMIDPHPGITEHEIKVKVFRLLDDMDQKIAERYLKTKKVHIQKEPMGYTGHVMIPKVVMDYLELRSGDMVDIIHCDKNCKLRAHQIDARDNDRILVSPLDLEAMGIKNRSPIAICKHVEG